MTPGDRIKKARSSRGLTQTDLAKKLNVTPAVISHYESGRRNPKLNTLIQIASAINCPIDELLSTEELGLANSLIEFYGNDSEEVKDITDPETTEIRFLSYKLNKKGKEKTIDYMKDISQIPAYRNDVTE